MDTSEVATPVVPRFLRGVTVLECLVVGWAAILLFMLPELGSQWWAWATPPFNSRYIGATYAGAFVPLAVLAIHGRWVPGRVVLWMILVFTAAVMVVMLAYPGRFEFDRPHTWAYWVLYLFLPVNSAVFLHRLRSLPRPRTRSNPTMRACLLLVLALALGAYAVALLAVPEWATSFWPWPVDDFHARIYAATYLTGAAGGLAVWRTAAASDLATYGATLLTFGAAAALGLFVTNATVPADRQLDLAEPGAVAFVVMHLVFATIGVALTAVGLRGIAEPTREVEGEELT